MTDVPRGPDAFRDILPKSREVDGWMLKLAEFEVESDRLFLEFLECVLESEDVHPRSLILRIEKPIAHMIIHEANFGGNLEDAEKLGADVYSLGKSELIRQLRLTDPSSEEWSEILFLGTDASAIVVVDPWTEVQLVKSDLAQK